MSKLRNVIILAGSGLLAGWLLTAMPTLGNAAEVLSLSTEEIQRLGEQMYREGILPSGKPMQAYVSGDVPVEGTAFTCVSCHLRSGLGSIEGEIVTPPTNGRILYQPRESFIKGSEHVPLVANYAKYLPVRPAYTDASLAALILNGNDPTGRSVLNVMPRYDLDDQEMAIMIAYLKSLSDQPSPGVTATNIKFATVIVEGSAPVDIESMLLPLQFSVDRKNSLATAAKTNNRVARMGYNMLGDLHGVTFTLSRWRLKGPPDSWRAQLDAYYQAEPVFALLGGISNSEWEPVHRFCEENRIPNLFPVVDYPVISESDWYTHYFSQGYRQEGEAAARYLHGMYDLFAGKPVVQLTRDSRKGKTLADGFQASWAQTGHPAVISITLPESEPLNKKQLQKVIDQYQPAVLLVWDDAQALSALDDIAGKKNAPGIILVSGSYLDNALWTTPESLRDKLHITYPYRLPQEEARFDNAVKKVLAGKSMNAYNSRIVRQSYMTSEILGKALMEMRGEYHRDFLFDTIGMMTDMHYPLYERVSFGPGQRYAAKGCFIVQIGKGKNPKLEKRSEWVIQ